MTILLATFQKKIDHSLANDLTSAGNRRPHHQCLLKKEKQRKYPKKKIKCQSALACVYLVFVGNSCQVNTQERLGGRKTVKFRLIKQKNRSSGQLKNQNNYPRPFTRLANFFSNALQYFLIGLKKKFIYVFFFFKSIKIKKKPVTLTQTGKTNEVLNSQTLPTQQLLDTVGMTHTGRSI